MFSDKASLPPFSSQGKPGPLGPSYVTTPNQGDTAQNSTYEDLSITEQAVPKKQELIRQKNAHQIRAQVRIVQSSHCNTRALILNRTKVNSDLEPMRIEDTQTDVAGR